MMLKGRIQDLMKRVVSLREYLGGGQGRVHQRFLDRHTVNKTIRLHFLYQLKGCVEKGPK